MKLSRQHERQSYETVAQVPCGQCLGCRISRADSWRLRMIHESRMHKRNCFVTLTYSPQNLPPGLTLVKRHWQLFAKRLRKAHGPFRYYHCGEYGDESLRPHYHALLFGFKPTDGVLIRSNGEFPLYTSPSLERLWGMGVISFGDVTPKSAGYVARYCLKKQQADHSRYERLNPTTGESWRVAPEYATMSRRPGLGAGWYEIWHHEVERDDACYADGRNHRPPVYYDKLLERRDPAALQRVKAARRDRVAVAAAHLPRYHERARESHALARLQRTNKGVI